MLKWFHHPSPIQKVEKWRLKNFGIQKKTIKKINVKKDFNEQSKELIRIINSWEATASRSNVCSAFEQTGCTKCQKEKGSQAFFMRVDINNAFRIRDIVTSPIVHGKDFKKRIDIQQFW